MQPAERIPLLKKLSKTLADTDDWQEIDLVLSEHDINTSGEWEGDQYSYVLYKLKTYAQDERLLELERYLDPAAKSDSSSSLTNDAGIWQTNAFRLFISHTHDQASFAGGMKRYLAPHLIDAFVAHTDLKPSVEWQTTIENALLTCHAAVALITPDFHASQWCDQEVGFCLARRLLVVPLMRGSTPKGFLGKFQGIRVEESQAATVVAERLYETFATRPETQARLASSMVRRYTKSTSYERTRKAYALLRQLPKDAWTYALIWDAERAAATNTQVQDANTRNGVSIPKALQKHLAPIKAYRESIGDEIPF